MGVEQIQSGTGREHISIRGGSLFVSKIKKGSVVGGAYVDCQCNDVDNATPASDLSHLDELSPSSHLTQSETVHSPNHTDHITQTTNGQTGTIQSD